MVTAIKRMQLQYNKVKKDCPQKYQVQFIAQKKIAKKLQSPPKNEFAKKNLQKLQVAIPRPIQLGGIDPK